MLDELLGLDPQDRERRLGEIAVQDIDTALELKSLLAEHAAADQASFLSSPLPHPQHVFSGQVLDRYTLDHLIGEGGMGSVWLAHRSDGRYEGEVAVKFLSLPAMSSTGRQRFEREGHVLARLKHPNIAHLLDAGVSSAGQPYLVLEYVSGKPLDVYCAQHGLNVRERIELFLQVLAAVSHAHGKLILHRDLKPSNILVNDEGQVKLLDFGIAKLLEDEGGAAGMTDITRLAGRAFTLDYAAPEQVQGGEVTTATDVYSLGVILYVLLTDQHPTASEASTPAERLRAVVETEPSRPSTIVLKTKGDGAEAPEQRARLLRGDLDNIVGKALKKEPDERYPTADALAQDLRRFLNNEPVSARADSIPYRLRKFIVRHALPVAAAGIVMVAIVAAAIISLWQAREAREQRDRALALSARNAAVVDFVTSMLTEIAPDDQPIRVSELLDRSEQVLLAGEVDPEHQAAILDVLGEYYLSAGNPSKAQPLLDRALQLTENTSDAALKATLICNNAHAISMLNRVDEALASLDIGIAMSRIDPLAASRCLQKRAFVAQTFNDPPAALHFATQAREALNAAPFKNPAHEAMLIGDIAYAHYLSGRTAEADRYYAEALSRYAQLGRGDSPATFSLRNNWGIASFAAGDNLRALENYDEALEIAKRRNPEGELPIYLLGNRALALASLARYEEAAKSFDEALAASQRANNVGGQLHALVNRAGMYMMMGDHPRAERELREVEQTFGAAIPPNSVPATAIQHIRGKLESARGDLDAALADQTAVIQFFDTRQMAVSPLTRALSARAEIYARRGDFAAARSDAQRAVEISRKLQDAKPHSSLTGLALLQLAQVELAAGDTPNAQQIANEAIPHLEATLGAEHPETLRAKGLCCEEQERRDSR